MAQQQTTDGGGGKLFYLLAGLIVLAGAAWLLLANRGGTAAELPTPAEFEALAAEVEADPSVGIALGAESAPVEIMEFADYSCPHCANFAGFAGKLLRQNYVEGGGPVRWVLYDYVLGTFPNSVAAHMAARCAGEQGLYWPMHDLLLARQARWTRGGDPQSTIASVAEEVGAEMGPYRECMNDGRYLPKIAASRKYGQSLAVSSTPTIFVNGEKIDLTGREPYSYVESLIQAELGEGSGSEETASSGP